LFDTSALRFRPKAANLHERESINVLTGTREDLQQKFNVLPWDARANMQKVWAYRGRERDLAEKLCRDT
jgi:hypothetical protein